MKFSDYLVKHHITSHRFATQLRVSVSSVNKWRIGNRMPRPAMLAKIKKATKGQVAPKDWY